MNRSQYDPSALHSIGLCCQSGSQVKASTWGGSIVRYSPLTVKGLPKPVRDIAWKAQLRLCARYRRLSAAGKKLPVVVAAIAREMAAFLWAIGREVAPV